MKPARAWFRLRFFFADAWDEFRHSPGVNLLALATLGTALFVAGLVMLVLANAERRVHTLRAEVDYGTTVAVTAYGTIGIKVWIFKGEILAHDPMAQDKRANEAAEGGRPGGGRREPQGAGRH